jgi:hypothetical protein
MLDPMAGRSDDEREGENEGTPEHGAPPCDWSAILAQPYMEATAEMGCREVPMSPCQPIDSETAKAINSTKDGYF